MCISTNSFPISSKFVLETNTIIDVNLRKIYERALPRACAVAIFSRASSKKCCRKTGISKKWPKIMIRRPPTEIFGDPMCFDRKFLKNDFGVRRAPISDFWPFFRFSISEISTTWEKRCFSRGRFFRKNNKNNSVVFSGRPDFSQKKRTNVTNLPFK